MVSILNKLKKIFHFLLAITAYWYYGRPARKLIVIGVTGTKGKSTTCRFIASVLESGGYKVGLLSTVEFQIGEKRWMNDKKMTMLGRGEIQKMLREMVEASCNYVIVETSSEGILQYRHSGLHYDIVVFTNLGTEHSERHGGFENLKHDKGKIFATLSQCPQKVVNGKRIEKTIIANTDDEHANYFLSFAADRKLGFGLKIAKVGVPNIFGKILNFNNQGIIFTVGDKKYELRILGAFNVYNALAAIAVGESQGVTSEQIARGLANVALVPGRMEFIEVGQSFKVIVDYAHEPLSLTALFTTLRQMVKPHNGRVIGVIGSDGGGRDINKRKKMGEIAGELCDYVVVTDVNCFDEDPKIIAEMLAGGARQVGKKDGENLFIKLERRQGIAHALSLATAGDVVAVTAKGTEPCMCIANGIKIPWDDRLIVRELLSIRMP